MPFEFHADMRLRVVSTLAANLHLGVNPTHDATLTVVRDILSGTGADQIDVLYERRRAITTGASISIDLNGTADKDVFENNLSMVTLCGVIIANFDVDGTLNTTNITIGGGANSVNFLGTAATTKIIRPGGVYCDICTGAGGIATITPATADLIQIANAAGATANVQMIFFGRST